MILVSVVVLLESQEPISTIKGRYPQLMNVNARSWQTRSSHVQSVTDSEADNLLYVCLNRVCGIVKLCSSSAALEAVVDKGFRGSEVGSRYKYTIGRCHV